MIVRAAELLTDFLRRLARRVLDGWAPPRGPSGHVDKCSRELSALYRLYGEIEDEQASEALGLVCDAAEKITRRFSEFSPPNCDLSSGTRRKRRLFAGFFYEKPAAGPDPPLQKQAADFADYYLPSLVGIVQRYVRLEHDRVSTPDSREFQARANAFFEDVAQAFNNLLESLYDADVLDASADMAVLKQVLERDGYRGTR
ncbi:MAG: 5-bromo-4-chloroindolyl phosphate hydrolysis family protein [Clostridiales bacterium]|jgi:hypothetical protein|nr:5-bromo-4-chloroindolyl phosphate hydrolysis family protein [Clostridiales bacterium]